MSEDFYKRQAQRARDLAAIDPFTRKRLLDLAERYDVRDGIPSRASRLIERPLPITRAAPVSRHEKPGET
jgi:hypothetical protein